MQSPAKRKKSSIPEDIQKRINCSLWECTIKMKHYAFDAVLLPCGGNACKQCVEDYSFVNGFDCSFCEATHEKKDINMAANQLVECMIKMYLDDLKENLLDEFTKSIESLSEEELKNKIEMRFSNAEIELDIRIESIKAGLDEYREGFKKELDTMKRKYKESLKIEELNGIKEKMDALTRDPLVFAEMDHVQFVETHKVLNESKLLLEKYANDVNQIKLNSDTKIIYRDLIGEMSVPLWKKVESITQRVIDDSTNLYDCVHWESKNMLIAIDESRFLIRYDLETETCYRIYESLMKNPYALCKGENDQLYVCDRIGTKGAYNILELNQKFKVKIRFSFDHKGSISCMFYDSQDERNLLYLLDTENNSVIIKIDSEKGREFKTVEIDRPCNIQCTKERIYITSLTGYHRAQTPAEQLAEINSGSNCIFILNRNYEIIDKIVFDNWLKPSGLSVQGDYILTTAYELYKNKAISNCSYLHVIKDKEIVRKIKIDDSKKVHYFHFSNNMAFILFSDSMKMIEFSDFK